MEDDAVQEPVEDHPVNQIFPDEVWGLIFHFLDPASLVAVQSGSKLLLRLARDDKLWRRKCFDEAPSATRLRRVSQPLGLGPLIADPRPSNDSTTVHPQNARRESESVFKRAKAVSDWDQTDLDETVDWYNEYIRRHAPLHITWSEHSSEAEEVRGVAVHNGSESVVGCTEDGSVCIWDIRGQDLGGRTCRQTARSRPGLLFATESPQSSRATAVEPFSGVTDCVSVDSRRNRAYIAIKSTLNEVDLDTLQVISQQQYAWRITALSQQSAHDLPLSIGTTWSLHLFDPRVPLRDRSQSPDDLLRNRPSEPEASIAFLPNYAKQTRFFPDKDPPDQHATWLQENMPRRQRRVPFAHLEPGPLSVLHHGEHDILTAGRFPSILSYDRRYFPKLQYVIHSGGSLSSLVTVPFAPRNAHGGSDATSTLVAGGDYNGRGSLELYALPHSKPRVSAQRPSNDESTSGTILDEHTVDVDQQISDARRADPPPYSDKNRQSASTARILSVAAQGTTIVFSDTGGGLNWVERDGRGEIRRVNIDNYDLRPRHRPRNTPGRTEMTDEELVARKIVPLHAPALGLGPSPSENINSTELLIWTGDRLGIVSTRQPWEDCAELAEAFDENKLSDDNGSDVDEAEQHSRAMRRALESQANERRWMSRFNRIW